VKLALLAALVRLLAATWRYRVEGWEHVAAARASGRPVIYVLWHSRILPLLYHRRDEGVALLISRHRDGGYLAELSERWGYRVVRGSSQRGGEAGLLSGWCATCAREGKSPSRPTVRAGRPSG